MSKLLNFPNPKSITILKYLVMFHLALGYGIIIKMFNTEFLSDSYIHNMKFTVIMILYAIFNSLYFNYLDKNEKELMWNKLKEIS